MQNTSDWLSNLKLRASYGTTGNDLNVDDEEIVAFSYLQKYNNGGSYVFGNNLANTITPGATPNLTLTWATSKTINGGLDFGFSTIVCQEHLTRFTAKKLISWVLVQ